ncbi:MAG: hypothetical protein ACP5HK_03685 [Acidilobus sp.]
MPCPCLSLTPKALLAALGVSFRHLQADGPMPRDPPAHLPGKLKLLHFHVQPVVLLSSRVVKFVALLKARTSRGITKAGAELPEGSPSSRTRPHWAIEGLAYEPRPRP